MATAPTPTPAPETPRRKRDQPKPSPFPARRKTVQLLLVFITLVLIIDALVGEKGLLETMRASRQHQDLTTSIERLRVENNRLREEVRRLRDDPSTIESVARQELGLIRPGELLFIVKDARPGR
jgi:cell division protein FtsB